MPADGTLARHSAICLALPGADRQDLVVHAAFRAGKKVFVYYLHDHHGDGIVGFACKPPLRENTALVAARPDRFYPPHTSAPAIGLAFAWIAAGLPGPKPPNSSVPATSPSPQNAISGISNLRRNGQSVPKRR
jgi:hypothetical protein